MFCHLPLFIVEFYKTRARTGSALLNVTHHDDDGTLRTVNNFQFENNLTNDTMKTVHEPISGATINFTPAPAPPRVYRRIRHRSTNRDRTPHVFRRTVRMADVNRLNLFGACTRPARYTVKCTRATLQSKNVRPFFSRSVRAQVYVIFPRPREFFFYCLVPNPVLSFFLVLPTILSIVLYVYYCEPYVFSTIHTHTHPSYSRWHTYCIHGYVLNFWREKKGHFAQVSCEYHSRPPYRIPLKKETLFLLHIISTHVVDTSIYTISKSICSSDGQHWIQPVDTGTYSTYYTSGRRYTSRCVGVVTRRCYL